MSEHSGRTEPDATLAASADGQEIASGPKIKATQSALENTFLVDAAPARPSTGVATTSLGPYQLLEKLGEGGMGAVYKARHTRLNKLVAVKVLPAHLTRDPTALARFEREMKAVGSLEHPNIVRAMDADEHAGTHYLVMEYVEGQDLQQLVKTRGPLSVLNSAKIIRQAARGLAHAHQHGLVHRDIKPSNLFVSKQGQVKLLDLGLARLGQEESEGLTSTGVSLGTPDYMAPEQWADTHSADARCDLYALGCTLFFLLTGRGPYGDERHKTVVSKLAGHVNESPPTLISNRSDVPAELERLYQQLLAKKLEERIGSAAELAKLIEPFCKASIAPAAEISNPSPDVGVVSLPGLVIPEQRPAVVARKTVAGAGVLVTGNGPRAELLNIRWRRLLSVLFALTVIIGCFLWFNGRHATDSRPKSSSNPPMALTGPAPQTSQASAATKSVLLIPLLKREHLADGKWQNIRVENERVTFDSSEKQRQLWQDFPGLQGLEMTVRSKLRIAPETKGGYTKLVFVGNKEADLSLIISDESGTPQLWLQSSPENRDAIPLSSKLEWPGGLGEFVEIAVSIANGKVSARVANQSLGEFPVNARTPRTVALNVAGWKCDFQNPRVEFPAPVRVASAASWHGWPADAPKPAIAPFEAAQARKHQEEWAAYLKVPVEYTNSIGMKFRIIPPGEFMMGSTPAEIDAVLKLFSDDAQRQEGIRSENPRHRVVLTQPSYLSTNEVTQGQYEQITDTNPSYFAPSGAGRDAVAGIGTTRHPVETVSWHDAAQFCVKLSLEEKLESLYHGTRDETVPLNGIGYRLPTEAEWEFACRAGTTSKYWNGDDQAELGRISWYFENSDERTHVVGTREPNPLGLHDVHGNVWEWVNDGWSSTYYQLSQAPLVVNPQCPLGFERILRGGNWAYDVSRCRASDRHPYGPDGRENLIGFRISLSAEAVRASLKRRGGQRE